MKQQESYNDFLNRILSFQNPNFKFGVERFIPSESIKSKVYDCGIFKSFMGDTVVFNLDESTKRFISKHYINPLYSVAPECLAERFKESTLHMTLHDLNASNCSDMYEMTSIIKKMNSTQILLKNIIQNANVRPQTIHMVTTCVFNMVNTSLVLGLKPKTPEDYAKLMALYCMVDQVHELPYPFTPHITLAYYSRNGFEGEKLEELQRVINELNQTTFEVELSTKALFYQKFYDMNNFSNEMRFVL